MKNILNHCFLIVTLFITSNLLAQKSSLHVNIMLENKSCLTDTTHRTVVVQILYNGKYMTVSQMVLKQCSVKTPIINGKYKFYVYAPDYETKEVELTVNSLKPDTINYPDIVLKKKVVSLNEVVVGSTANKGGIQIQGDKMIVDLKGNALLSGGSSFEALEKAPGVLIDQNGRIVLNGKAGTKIWIDGVPSNLTGEDLVNYLRSLPANVIKKMEIISNPGASYDAQSSGGIINLITNKQKLKGITGSFNINTGFSKYAKEKVSLRLGIKYKAVDFQTVAVLSADKGFTKTVIEKQLLTNNTTEVFNQTSNAIANNQFFYLRNNLDFHINTRTILGFRYNYSSPAKKTDTENKNILLNQLPAISLITSGQARATSNQNELGIYFREVSKKSKIKLELSADYSIYSKENNLPLYENALINSVAIQSYSVSNNTFEQKIKSTKVSVFVPLVKTSASIELGAKYTNTEILSNGSYNLHNATDIVKEPVYNQFLLFKYNENISAGYLVVTKKINKLGLSAGSRIENTQTKSLLNGSNKLYDTSYTNFFPSATLSYPLSKLLTYTLGYSKRINRPGYADLDPNINYSDSLSLQKGNPFLKPGYLHSIESKLIFFYYASLSFSYSTEKNSSYLVIDKDALTNQTTTTTKNFDNTKSYFGMLLLPVPLPLITQGAKWLKNIGNVNAENISYIAFTAAIQHTKVANAQNYLPGNKPVYFYGINSSFVLPNKYKLQLNYRVNTRGNYGLYTLNPVSVCDIALAKSFLNKKLNVAVSVNDIFKSSKVSVNGNFPNNKVNYNSTIDSRVFRLSLTYNFGKFNFFEHKKEVKTSGEEEAQRANSQKTFKTGEN
jgi:iron complex outermembrane recepter protein